MGDSYASRGCELDRHALVWLDPRRAPIPEVAPIDRERAERALAAWIAAGWPFVVRRQVGSGWLSLGMPLPPESGKWRVPVRADERAVVRCAPPLTLREMSGRIASHPWLGALSNAAADEGLELSVFGSFAWEALTGQRYVTPSSDLDVLVRPSSTAELERATRLLSAWERVPDARRIDGEILFALSSGEAWAVSWREWKQNAEHHATAGRVLGKSLRETRLCDVGVLAASLATGAP
jgi:phosphoribosyl-dephospho-CoA transferase